MVAHCVGAVCALQDHRARVCASRDFTGIFQLSECLKEPERRNNGCSEVVTQLVALGGSSSLQNVGDWVNILSSSVPIYSIMLFLICALLHLAFCSTFMCALRSPLTLVSSFHYAYGPFRVSLVIRRTMGGDKAHNKLARGLARAERNLQRD